MSNANTENPDLCWKCQALLNTQYPEDLVVTAVRETEREPDKKQIRTFKTFDSVETTASNGCILCLNLLHALGISARATLAQLTSAIGGPPHEVAYEYDIFLGEGKPPFISLHADPENLILGWNDGNEINSCLRLFPEAEIAPYVTHGEVSASTNSDASWSVVANWLDQEAKGISGKQLYTSFTICYNESLLGFPNTSAVKSGNLAEFQKQIPTSQLSQSFQDAFLVTQRLGLNYIWIDSLCIIQDSAADWETAAHAADGTQGCFVGRNPNLVNPLKVNLNWGPKPGKYYAIQWLYWRQNVMETPLNLRAWVYQERYLAPRNIFFGTTQLYWECCGLVASETFPFGLPAAEGSPKSLDPHIGGVHLRKELGLSEAPELGAFSLWDLIVSTYSKGKLTFSTDKLVALSGLAARMEKYIHCQYLAGMWRKDLAYQLLWTVGGIQWVVTKSRPEVYTAPSWSWASMHGHIEDACVVRHADGRDIVLEILDVGVDLVNDINPFEQLKGGFLRLQCSLAKGGVHLEESPSNRGSFRLIVNGSRLGSASLDDFIPGVDRVSYHDYYYLPVRYNARYESVNRNGVEISVPSVAGLVLHSIRPETQSEFVRVGRFEISSSPKYFQSACRQHGVQHSRELPRGKAKDDLRDWGPKWEIVIL